MKVEIEVSDDDRRVIARWFGASSKASARTVTRWAQNVIEAELETMSSDEAGA